MFGKKREELIKRTRVREIFTPSRPINTIELLFGREPQVTKLVEILNTPGQHALLFGDRGVGKSSLAKVVTLYLLAERYYKDNQIFFKRCDSEDTFESVLEKPLKNVGVDVSVKETTNSHQEKGKAEISAGFASADIESSRQKVEKRIGNISASFVAEKLEGSEGVLVVDEADAIQDSANKKKLAELIKHLSDCNSKFKLLVVGIADTGADLLGKHPSIQRCLVEVPLDRMSDIELRKIIETGQRNLSSHRLSFDHDVINMIVKVSNGYPYFTHLLALKCAEEAIVASRSTIRKEDLQNSTQLAAEGAEGSLKNAYQDAIRSHWGDGALYKYILLAAATLGTHEFSAKDLRAKVCELCGRDVTQTQLNNFYKGLISDQGTVLRRLSKGVYCFSDPRMPSYIRIANAAFS